MLYYYDKADVDTVELEGMINAIFFNITCEYVAAHSDSTITVAMSETLSTQQKDSLDLLVTNYARTHPVIDDTVDSTLIARNVLMSLGHSSVHSIESTAYTKPNSNPSIKDGVAISKLGVVPTSVDHDVNIHISFMYESYIPLQFALFRNEKCICVAIGASNGREPHTISFNTVDSPNADELTEYVMTAIGTGRQTRTPWLVGMSKRYSYDGLERNMGMTICEFLKQSTE